MMADIYHEFTIKASPKHVFEVMATPAGLNRWWTKECSGELKVGAEYRLNFGPKYDWRAQVTKCEPDFVFELQMTRAHDDWMGTRVGFELQQPAENVTRVLFNHTGWPSANDHWRISSYCWAMYLRLVKRYIEYGEIVPYEKRLEV